MERRMAIKIVALSALLPKVDTAGVAWSAVDYKLQFFTQGENEILDRLMEMILPEDRHSPGAHAAQVSLFADRMVTTGRDAVQRQWREGLQLIEREAAGSSWPEAVAKAAVNEGHPTTDLERFFAVLKETTVNGYYTSAIGIHQDLQYQGNTYLESFPGCPQKVAGPGT